MRHLIVLSEDEIRALLNGKKIEVISYGNPPIFIMSEDTFKTEETD